MPWSHCDRADILDTDPCPGCGISKESWTVEFNLTRDFVVRRRPTLRLVLFDSAEEEVAHERYRVDLPDGEVVEGELDDTGRAKIVHTQAGEATICFPDRPASGVTLYVDDRAEQEAAGGARTPERGDRKASSGPATFTLSATRRHRFQLAGPWVLQLTLLDEEGEEPLAFFPYSIECQGSSELRFEGTTDSRGRLDHGPVSEPRFVLFVETSPAGRDAGEEALEASLSVPSVLPADAFLSLPVPGIPRLLRDPHELVVGGSWLTLLDHEGLPIPGEPFVVELPSGERLEEALDPGGGTSAPELENGDCVIRFSMLRQAEVLVPEDGAAEPLSDDPDATASFRCSSETDHIFHHHLDLPFSV